ncbi:rRNA maturation RNase YbeY [Cucumibacter marinus]|uniref:rRNA maturation RNase YbeY n=1 Tax=Cucumibacter marinus TaxID=1121252 RepID=UPI00041E1AAC|nr:rRNA maturation RNase YbeY [Cucumibacter marinus]
MTPDLSIDITIEAGDWPADLEPLAERALLAALEGSGRALAGPAEISVLLTTDAAQRELNARWREIDKPTNVLSFPQIEPEDPVMGLLGDISLAIETLEREAEEQQKPFAHHFAHLLVHGFLHILGYDHIEDDEAEAMEARERTILAQLDIPDPYDHMGVNDLEGASG